MKRIDERTVELTPAEMKISLAYEAMLDEGFGIEESVGALELVFGTLVDGDFFEYLRS